MQQTLLLLTEQVSRLASRVDSLTQAAQSAPAAEDSPALHKQVHLKEVVQQELWPLMEQTLHSLTARMLPARAPLPAPAMLEAVQQGLTPHHKGVAAQQQRQLVGATPSYKDSPPLMLEHITEPQSAQQQQLVRQPVLQQLVRQLVHRSPTSSASDVALSRQLASNHTLPATSPGGGCNALFLRWSHPCHVHVLVASFFAAQHHTPNETPGWSCSVCVRPLFRRWAAQLRPAQNNVCCFADLLDAISATINGLQPPKGSQRGELSSLSVIQNH